MRLTKQRRPKSKAATKNKMLTTFATHCRLQNPIILVYVCTFHSQRDDLCILSVPQNVHSHSYKTPPHSDGMDTISNFCLHFRICMHASEQWSSNFHTDLCRQTAKEKNVRLIKYNRIKVIHLAINAIHNGMHNFVVVFVAICRLRRRFRCRCDTFNAKTVR